MRWWMGTLVLLALGAAFRMGLLVYAMFVFLGILAISRLGSRRWIANLEVTRELEVETAEIGESATVRLTLRNLANRSVPWLLIEEALPPGAAYSGVPRLRVTGPRLAVAALRPREVRTLEYRLDFLMRGYYQVGPTLLESGDLFGLHRRYRIAADPRFVLVRPRVLALEGYDLASRRPMGEVRISHRLFEDPTRIRGIRPYERGDPLNRIHWRATARTGVLHSKSYEPSCVAGATLLLDFHRTAFVSERRPDPGSNLPSHVRAQLVAAGELRGEGVETSLVELAVTTAASLANAVYELGQQVGLASNGRDAAERVRMEGWRGQFRTRSLARSALGRRSVNERLQPVQVETRRGPDQFERILDTLARLELSEGLSFSQLVDEIEGRLPRDATIAAILTRVSETTAITLGNLRRSGFAVTAVVVSFEEATYHDWASAPDWAARLMAEGIPFRRVQDEESLTRLCAEHFVR